MKRPKIATVELHGCTATGPTQQVVNRLMTELLANNHEGTYAPYAIAWRGRIGVVWREPNTYMSAANTGAIPCCWNYTVVDGNELVNVTSITCVGTTSASINGARTDAIAAMRWSMAQSAWDGTEADIVPCAAKCMPINIYHSPAAFRTWAHEVLRLPREAI